MLSKTRLVLMLPLLFVVALGCASTKRNGAGVHGKVTFNGEPVGGSISFYPKGEEAGGGYGFPLKNGAYEGSSMPPGDYVVAVETESSNPDKKKLEYGPRGGGKKGQVSYADKMKQMGKAPTDTADFGKYVKIPGKYNDRKTTPLTATLTNGNNKKDFELSD